jgi:hypothetical protein
MSRLKVAGLAIAATMILAGSQGAMAGGLDKEERKEVEEIVGKAVKGALAEFVKELKGAQFKAGPERHPEHSEHKPPHPGPGASLHLLQDILHEQEICEDREKVGRALKYLIDGSGCSKCGKSDCGHYGLGFYPGHCDYYRPDGSIDFARLLDCELRRQDLIEDRQKLGRALKYLIKDDCNSCTPKCETSCTEPASYHSPRQNSVVLESPVRYYRYVNCD